jgi:hypothetical protein
VNGPVHGSVNGLVDPDQYRRRQDRAVTAVVGGVCGLGCAGALVPAVERAITFVLLTLAAAAIVVAAARGVARVLRESREDRADTLAAAAWRAEHLPDHALVALDRLDRATPERAGVS